MANQLAGEKPNTMANAPVSKTNTASPNNPNNQQQQQQTPPAGNAPAGGQQQQQSGKLTQQQMDQKKAELKSRRATGQNFAAAGGTGYKDSRTGVPVQKMVGADAQGNPKFQTVREQRAVGYSKFLGAYI